MKITGRGAPLSQEGKKDVGTPDTNHQGGEGRRGDSGGNHLYIQDLHYTANDLSEIRKIAEDDRALANKLVDNQETQHRREAVSERIGLIATALLAGMCVSGAVLIVITLGWWQTIVFVVAMLGVSHLVRTILTGEWSDTSWIGRTLKPKADED